MESLITRDRTENIFESSVIRIDSIDWGIVPPLSEFAMTFAGLRPMVGVGEDRIGSELLKVAPLACAKVFHPLVLKSALAIQPPIQWKGEHLFELFKGKDDKYDIRLSEMLQYAKRPLSHSLNQ